MHVLAVMQRGRKVKTNKQEGLLKEVCGVMTSSISTSNYTKIVTEEVETLYLVKYETLAKQIKSSNSRNKKSGLVSTLVGFGRNMIAALFTAQFWLMF